MYQNLFDIVCNWTNAEGKDDQKEIDDVEMKLFSGLIMSIGNYKYNNKKMLCNYKPKKLAGPFSLQQKCEPSKFVKYYILMMQVQGELEVMKTKNLLEMHL